MQDELSKSVEAALCGLELPPSILRRFKPLSVLGSGGHGLVLRARQMDLDRDVALKLLLPTLYDDPTIRQRFLQEARLVASISHFSIVPIFDHGIEDEVPYIAFQFIQGHSLREAIQRGPLGFVPACAQALRIAQGLEAIHAAGVIHRDLKPENILVLQPSGQAMIADFGISKPKRSAIKTEAGLILGTPGYMAPEYLRDQEPDVRTDIYALGIILWEMLVGFRPLQRRDPGDRRTERGALEETILAVHTPPPSIALLDASLPQPLVTLVDRMVAPAPQQRPASAAEIVTAFEAIQRSSPADTGLATVAEGRSGPLPSASERQRGKGGEDSTRARARTVSHSAPAGSAASLAAMERRSVPVLGVGLFAMLLGVAAGVWIMGRSPGSPVRHPTIPTVKAQSVALTHTDRLTQEIEKLRIHYPRRVTLRPYPPVRPGDTEADCPAILLESPQSASASLDLGHDEKVILINGTQPLGENDLSALRLGLNWIRLRLPPNRRPMTAMTTERPAPCISSPDPRLTEQELGAYEKVRAFIQTPQAECEGAVHEVLWPEFRKESHPIREVAEAYARLGRTLREFRSFWTMAESFTTVRLVWDLPRPLQERRVYLDRLQTALLAYPDRWYLWVGLAWGLQWSDHLEEVSQTLLRGLEAWPQCPWSWVALADWEQTKWEERQEGRLRKSRDELLSDAICHTELAMDLLAKRRSAATQKALEELRQRFSSMLTSSTRR